MRTSLQTTLLQKTTLGGNEQSKKTQDSKASEEAQKLPFTYTWDEELGKLIMKNEATSCSSSNDSVSPPIKSYIELMSLKVKNEISHEPFMCRTAELIKEFPQNANNIVNLLIFRY